MGTLRSGRDRLQSPFLRVVRCFDVAIVRRGRPPKHEMVRLYGIVGIPLVATQARFLKPSKFGDLVVVESTVQAFKRASFDVQHRLFNGGELAVEGFETRVWTGRDPQDPSRLRSQTIPPEVIARFGLAPA